MPSTSKNRLTRKTNQSRKAMLRRSLDMYIWMSDNEFYVELLKALLGLPGEREDFTQKVKESPYELDEVRK